MYKFTSNQLHRLLWETIEMYQEQLHEHGSLFPKRVAVQEMVEGLDYEMEGYQNNEWELASQSE